MARFSRSVIGRATGVVCVSTIAGTVATGSIIALIGLPPVVCLQISLKRIGAVSFLRESFFHILNIIHGGA
jgi:hypothetical protein